MGIPALAHLIAATVNGNAAANSATAATEGLPAGLDFAALLAEQLPPGLQKQLLATGTPPGEPGSPSENVATFPPGLALGLKKQALGADAVTLPAKSAAAALAEAMHAKHQGDPAPTAEAPATDEPDEAATPPLADATAQALGETAVTPALPSVATAGAAPAKEHHAGEDRDDTLKERPAATDAPPQAANPPAIPVLPAAVTAQAQASSTPAAEHAPPIRLAAEQASSNPSAPPASAAASQAAANASETAKVAVSGTPAADNVPPTFTQALGTATANAARTQDEAPIATNLRVDTPLHDRHWAPSFGERVVWLAKNEQQSAQISIHPPQLGPIQITLNMNGDQASAVFSSPHAEVRQAIQEALPQLREMMASSGIALGQANVGSQHPQQGREFASQFAHGNRFGGENAILPGDTPAASGTMALPIQRGRGLVDLFA